MVGRGNEGAGSLKAMAVQTEEDLQVEIEEEEEEEELILTEGKGRQTNRGFKAKTVKGSVNHPPYREMITEALVELKERNGSSQAAIAKFIEQKYKAQLQPNFKKVLFTQLKNLTMAGELTRIKNSFKLKANARAVKKIENKKTKKSDGAAKVGKTKQTKQPTRSTRKISTPRKTPKTIKKAKPST